MRKTLQDVAGYLKEIMVPETYEAYVIDPAYTNVSAEESIREGVLAFRAFLCRRLPWASHIVGRFCFRYKG